MFGFLIGAACLGGLAAIAFHRPHHHPFGHHHWHGRWGGGFRGGRGGFRRFALYRALDHLDATPGQEKAIMAALDEFEDVARTARGKVNASRSEVASALRSEQFEAERMDAVIARHAEDVAAIGSAARVALGKVHEALDSEQRKRLASWLEYGPRFHCA